MARRQQTTHRRAHPIAPGAARKTACGELVIAAKARGDAIFEHNAPSGLINCPRCRDGG